MAQLGDMTIGQIYYYGGIALAGIAFLAMILSVVVCEQKKKKFLRNIDKETE